MTSRIHRQLKSLMADGVMTKAEWEGKLKGRFLEVKAATPEARELLEAWANDGWQMEEGVREDMRRVLRAAGYDIADTLAPSPSVIPGVVERNVTEVDADFEWLLKRAGRTDASTVIAVMDGGFELDHAALADRLWTNPGEVEGNGVDDDGNGLVDDVHGWDFAEGDADVSGGDHGSHVSGIATRGNRHVREIAVRAFDPLDPQKVADAIDYVCTNGARVVNMSFKVDDENEVALVKAAMERHPDVLFVKSAGNDGNRLEEGKTYGASWYSSSTKVYGEKSYLPMAGIANMVVVASAEPGGERADYSNHGAPWVTVAMQGSKVYSSVPGQRYESMDGTSMAAPNVTSVIARCLALAPDLTPAEVRTLLIDCTEKKEAWADLCESGGLVDAARAMRLASLIGMVRGGEEPRAAATRLQLKGDERKLLLSLLEGYPTPEPAPTPVADYPV